VGQVWRSGRQQANLARLLRSPNVETVALDIEAGKQVGLLLAKTGTRDVVDGHVALLAPTDGVILTSDPNHISALLAAREVTARLITV
jgi:hypothetical protein